MKGLIIVAVVAVALFIGSMLLIDPVPAYADEFNPVAHAPADFTHAVEVTMNCKNYLGLMEARFENIGKVGATVGLMNKIEVPENCSIASIRIDSGFVVERWHKTVPIIGNKDQQMMVLLAHSK